ncbi:arginine repressor [Clostridium tetani]|uniref:Arginine repressor n=2 Tax=Clostridium tetani TaxID=1513 RepID=ARGR_CLOTE|nr:arginine repressor [Clostridium tetani]Q894H3.1 RecName: Full=Arginine repressor [Clostridium tetani E88]AAO36119.1 arginine repressor [Clostridium tetani E88]AVP54114.1 arginine repressor [Clostridium tetani]KGI37925.1 ArgR family transcriptional regulator [Clostridium tetani]KGI39852.1 ArgR family transcriptional regulator [Clostridium tetani ATCC 9441]KGI43879.1 ArgR family transcriptional regulator [Clostridium tetani]
MKVTRHEKILELIERKDIETQEELAEELRKSGIEITQATVSRDIKELKLIKVLGEQGKYKYAAIVKNENDLSDKLANIFSHSVVSVENINNFVVVKTLSGSGNAAAEAIDSLNFKEIAGTIAGDNTIFIMARTSEQAFEIVKKMKRVIRERGV